MNLSALTSWARLKAALRGIDFAVLANRVVAGAAVLSADQTFTGAIPGKTGAMVTGALSVVAAMGPGVLKASGMVRATSPDQDSALTSAVKGTAALLSAPKAARDADAKALATAVASDVATQAVMAVLTKTGQFTPEQLGQVAAQSVKTEVASAVEGAGI